MTAGIREMDAPEVFEILMTGILHFRTELDLPLPPTRAEMAAVWSWARRVVESGDEIEQSILHNIIDGEMWADWQNGSIVFRVSPVGMARVEELWHTSGYESLEDYMKSIGLTVPERTAARPES